MYGSGHVSGLQSPKQGVGLPGGGVGVAGGQWAAGVLGVAVAVDVGVELGVTVLGVDDVAVRVAVEPATGTGVNVAVGTGVAVGASGLPWLKPHAARTRAMEIASDSIGQLGWIIARSNHEHVCFPTAAA